MVGSRRWLKEELDGRSDEEPDAVDRCSLLTIFSPMTVRSSHSSRDSSVGVSGIMSWTFRPHRLRIAGGSL